MNVLSLFDGIACARVALDRADLPVKTYVAYEIDPHASKVALKNYPSIVHHGDVTTCRDPLPIDLLIGGSPCTDLSIAKKNRKGLQGDKSKLFWEYVRILKLMKPTWFILENVASMPAADRDVITAELGVQPIMIDAALVSAQIRRRLFWTNIPVVGLPEDKHILLKDIMEPHPSPDPAMANVVLRIPEATKKGYAEAREGQSVDLSFPNSKTRRGRVGDKAKNLMTSSTIGVVSNGQIRPLTPVECERLQGLPDNYTDCISTTQRSKCLGNAFNVDVIAFLLKHIPKTE